MKLLLRARGGFENVLEGPTNCPPMDFIIPEIGANYCTKQWVEHECCAPRRFIDRRFRFVEIKGALAIYEEIR